ncbi:hypothetical protein FRC01_007866 [Tulasnella sp. 417]|nr:hypothetical protein FRC01_007866 [Tulasnella sp. 417]
MDEPGPGVWIQCRNNVLQDKELIGAFGSMDKVTTLEAQADWREESLQTLFGVLGKPTTRGFPSLKNLKLRDWKWGTEGIVKMLKARFPDNGTEQAQLPNLTIEFSSIMPWWWFGHPLVQRQIIDLNAVKRISAISGIERVHFGSAGGEVGMLGVVWSDELVGPTWG